MLKIIRWFSRRAVLKDSRGVGLVEVMIAIVVLAFITASVPPALMVITQNQYRWNEQRTAENIARNVIEYVKVTQYIAGNSVVPKPGYNISNLPMPTDMWFIDVLAEPVEPGNTTKVIDGTKGYWDLGIQRITVSIDHVSKPILTTVDYKGNRTEIWQPPI